MTQCFVAIGHSDAVPSATFSFPGSPSWSAAFPPENLRLLELAKVARTIGTNPADTILYVDFGTAKTIRVIAIKAHNLRSTATVRVKLGNSQGGTEGADSGALSAWPFTPLDGVYDGSHFEVIVVLDADSTGRHLTLELSDNGNPDGYLQIGHLFAGPAFIPADSPEVGDLSDGWMQSNSAVERTENGAPWVHERDEMRSVAVGFSAMSMAEGSTWREIQRTHKIVRPVVYIPSIADREQTQQDGFTGLLRELSPLDYSFSSRRSASAGIDEIGGAP
jgi:hypothetical protein